MFPLVKSVYIVPIGVWVGSWALYAFYVQRRAKPLLVAGLSCLLAFALSRIGVIEGFKFSVSLDITKLPESIWRNVINYGVLVGTAAAVLLALDWRSKPNGKAARNLAILFLAASAAIICLPVFVVVTYQGTIVTNVEQWFTPVAWIASAALVLSLSSGWNVAPFRRRALVGGVLAAYLSFPILAKASSAVVLLRTPESWHEFVDNGPITPALAAIPVKGSLIATNDLRYPANFYARDRRQFQIAALFGHHAYGAGLRYDIPPDADERAAKQELLQQTSWTPQISRVACESGWTHVLLSKRVPYVSEVPGTRLYENDAYVSYQLPACGKDL